MVGQEPVLYARSIKDNIRYGLDDVTDHVIVESARQANAHDFITSLDQQYDTGLLFESFFFCLSFESFAT